MKGLTHEQSAKLKDAMREYKAQGHTNKEVAEKFGYTVTYTTEICKGICPQEPPPRDKELLREKLLQYHKQSYLTREQDAINVINERIPWFEYAGNYTGSEGTVDLRCKKCGNIVNRSWVTVKHRKVRCDNCYQEEIKRIAEEKQKAKAHEAELARERKKHLKEANRRANQLSFSFCEVCGGMFFSERKGAKYCSATCANNVRNSVNKDKRVKRLRSIVIDKDITLQRLFSDSKGKCALCGGECDWNDYHLSPNGAFIADNNYPSIDHIMPISRGGLHEWGNVQLAHRICNTRKRNHIPR